jgi:putative membrane protein
MMDMIRGRSVLAIAMAASLVFVAACDRADDDVDEFAADTLGTEPAAAPAPYGETVDDLPATDGGVVDLVAAIDRSEIEASQLARDRAQDEQVKNFAQQVHDDHTQNMRQLDQLAQSAGIENTGSATPAPAPPPPGAPGTPPTTTGAQGQAAVANLEAMHQQTMSALQSATAADFDRAFVDGQVSGHQQALSILQQVQSRVQDEQLRQHLTQTIATVQQHLQQAQQLQRSVGTGGTMGDTARTR